jgi:hypothetical protein
MVFLGSSNTSCVDRPSIAFNESHQMFCIS